MPGLALHPLLASGHSARPFGHSILLDEAHWSVPAVMGWRASNAWAPALSITGLQAEPLERLAGAAAGPGPSATG